MSAESPPNHLEPHVPLRSKLASMLGASAPLHYPGENYPTGFGGRCSARDWAHIRGTDDKGSSAKFRALVDHAPPTRGVTTRSPLRREPARHILTVCHHNQYQQRRIPTVPPVPHTNDARNPAVQGRDQVRETRALPVAASWLPAPRRKPTKKGTLLTRQRRAREEAAAAAALRSTQACSFQYP